MGMDRKIKKKKWPPKRILKYAAIATFVLVVGYMLAFQTGESTLNVKKERITISEVTFGPFQEDIPIIGVVIPKFIYYLDPSEGGRVEEIFVESGSIVKEGEPIIRLSNTNLLMDIMYREAELFQQSNNLRNTRLSLEQNRLRLSQEMAQVDWELLNYKRMHERNEILFKENLIPQHQYQQVKDQYEYLVRKRVLTAESQDKEIKSREGQINQLEAGLSRMQENLKIVKQKQANLTVKAPVDGLLSSLIAEIGESKSPGQRLGQVDKLEGFRVRAEIDEHYIARIEKGKMGKFDFAGNAYVLSVQRIYLEVRDGKFEVDLFFPDDEEPEGLRRGLSLHIRLALGDLSEAVLLPMGGFYQTTGGNWVYVVDKSGSFAIKRKIRLGMQTTQSIEVLEGLEKGEKVITSSYENFGDMDRLILK